MINTIQLFNNFNDCRPNAHFQRTHIVITNNRFNTSYPGQKFMIKSISKAARLEIEKLTGTRVYLELWVKVRPKWRQKEDELRRLGYG